MACQNDPRLLHAYLDGELDAVRCLEFEEHLKSCHECAGEVAGYQAIRQSMRAPELYQSAPERLKARIRAGRPCEAVQIPAPVRRHSAVEWLAIAAAIIIALFIGARVFSFMSGQRETSLQAQEVVSSHIRSLQPGHLFDVQSTDQHTVKPWFDGRLDFAPPVKDLATQGFPLVGGRLDYVDRRNVAALVYQRQKHIVNVFVWPMEMKPASPPEAQTIQGYNVIFWWKDGMLLCAVSDLNLAELRQFAQLLQQ